jgi:predicted RNase H-like HicB family nuclease
MDLKITIEIWQKGRWYVARCPELDFVSQGATQTEARHNLLEVIQIQFEEMNVLGTLEDYLYPYLPGSQAGCDDTRVRRD